MSTPRRPASTTRCRHDARCCHSSHASSSRSSQPPSARGTGRWCRFAAATGLRPGEWLALQWRDIDWDARLVHVRRAFRASRVKTTKTEHPRAVPLQRSALDALDSLPRGPREPTALLFPAPEGGHLDLHNWRPRHWRPAHGHAGISPVRRVYDLRHTFATFALHAGVGTFDLSRYMGTSLVNIDRTYGHLTRDGHHRALALLDRDVDVGGRFVDAVAPATTARNGLGNRQLAASSAEAL